MGSFVSGKLIGYFTNLISPILIIIAGYILTKIILKVAKKLLQRSGLDEALHKFILTIIRYLLYVVIILMALDQIGVDTKSLITVMGVAGGAVALSLKDSLSNVAGGFIILVTKPFSRGDFVDIDGTSGNVESIDMLLTTLKTYDNKVITIPNGEVSTAVITNFTRADKRRVDCIFSLSHDTNIEKAKNVMIETASKYDKIISDDPITAGVAQTTPFSINMEFKVWAKTEDYWDVKYYLEENIKQEFDRAGIVLAKNSIISGS